MLILYLKIFAAGLLLSTFLWGWRSASAKWEKWFPPARWIVQGVLYAGLAFIFWGLGKTYLSAKEIIDFAYAGSALGTGLAIGLFIIWKMPEWRHGGESHERGASIANKRDVISTIQKRKKGGGSRIIWDGVKIPFDVEPFHFMVTGSTGSGKSVAIRQLLNVIRERGDTAVIVDSGGEFMASYARRGDAIINPFDDRCAPLNLMLELEGSWDADSLSRSIIPDGTGDSKEWNGYAQTFLSACMQVLCDKGVKDFKDLMWMVQVATIEELAPLLKGTAAASQLASEKTFGSIRTIASNYLKSYSFLKDSGSSGFSVSRFIKAETPNFLFLTYRDDQLDSLKDMISCILDITARTVLSMKPDSNRRIWLIVDEFASIGKVQSVEAFATKARKCGGCLLLCFQSISQLKDRYGEHQAQSILSCLSSSLILRCSDFDTAEAMSKMLGEHDVSNKSKSVGDGSRSWSEQKVSKRVALAPELQQLKNCEGFLKLSGDYPICKVTIPFPKKSQPVTPQFKARDFVKNPMVKPMGSLARGAGDMELGSDSRKAHQAKAEAAPAIETDESREKARLEWQRQRDESAAQYGKGKTPPDPVTEVGVSWDDKRAGWGKLPYDKMSAAIRKDVGERIKAATGM